MIWILFGILYGFILWKLHEIYLSVQLWFLYVIDRLLARDSEIDMRRERCVFFFGDFNVATPQRRSSTHTHTHTLTNTITFTHTHDWPTVASRASGSRGVFSGFANIFGPQVVSKNFLDRQGVTQHPKIFPEC